MVKRNEARLDEMGETFTAVEAQLVFQRKAQTEFEQKMEAQLHQLLKLVQDGAAKTNGKEVIAEGSPAISGSSSKLTGMINTLSADGNQDAGNTTRIPKVFFPAFDGTNPRT